MNDAPSARVEWMRTVVEEHQGRLIRFALRITGDLDTARDVVQDTFLRLCREGPERTRDHITPWLFTVCRNRALDVRKKEGPLMPLDDVALATLEGTTTSPQTVVERGESSRRVLAILGELPASQQEVLRLRFQEELSYKEISAVTKHSVTNVGFLIHTALKRLREKLNVAVVSHEVVGGPNHA